MQDTSLACVLTQILIDQLCFLELSPSDVVDEDAAVVQMESITAALEALDDANRKQLIALLAAEAAAAASRKDPARRIEFIDGLPDALGLAEDPERS